MNRRSLDDETLDLFGDAGEGERPASPPARPAPEEPAPPVEPPPPPTWTVSELNRALRGLLERSLSEIHVTGEVANWTRARSGHCYFTLKDEDAQLRCVMWRRSASRLPIDPEEGMALRVRGRVTLYEARGDVQLQVEEVEADGKEGLWKLAFERLRKRLQEEGLLDAARKRPLPRFPRTVGVVTSPTGAAIRDVLTVVRRRAPWTRVLVRGARVQGEGAAEEIARAVRVLGGSGRIDVLVVGRGGGSIEDLWAFNEEPVARAIAECPVPVISAVGHETDVTISDLVADHRAPTPSAAAEAAVQDAGAIREILDHLRPRLARGLHGQVERRKARLGEGRRRVREGTRRLLEARIAALDRLSHRLGPALRGRIAPARDRVGRGSDRLGHAIRRLVHERRSRLATAAGRVEALSPLSTLRRGYAVPLGAEGRVLRGTRDFEGRPRFQLRVVDGRIECDTRDIRPDEASR